MSAPNLREIEWAIHELEQKESSFAVYAKLADLYTVRNEMLGLSAPQSESAVCSQAAVPVREPLGRYGDSDFLRAAEGKDPAQAWAVMDELMETLRMLNGRAYQSVMRKMEAL